MLLEGKWLLYLNAIYRWVSIKKYVLIQFYHNIIFPSFPWPSIYMNKGHKTELSFDLFDFTDCVYH